MGAIAFRILIPIAMLLLAVYLFKREAVLKRAAVRLIVFAGVFYAIIPCSVWISTMIEKTYADSIEKMISAVEELNEEIQEVAQTEGVSEETGSEEAGSECTRFIRNKMEE